jgi:hypothetical protein
MAEDHDTPLVIPAEFWGQIEKHVRLAQGLAQALVTMTHSDCDPREALHALGGLAEALDHHVGECFSRITDPGHLEQWERDRERRARTRVPALRLVEAE